MKNNIEIRRQHAEAQLEVDEKQKAHLTCLEHYLNA
jgi:hypothetical protein